MTTYSHSKLGTFQQCKQKYKFQYIDKIKTPYESIEAFMGKLVHEVLEKLYKDLKFEKLNSKDELLTHFKFLWDGQWHDKIVIVKEYTQQNYKDMGKKFISEYYDHYKPFDSFKTIGLETQDMLELSDGNKFHVRIDRLACDKDGNYYVCDYKTNNQLKPQGELDEDQQLAMYSIWVKQKYPDARSVKLVWFFLAHDKEMISVRNEEQLAGLKQQVEELIKEVEACEDFPTNVSALCNYCSYKSMCPAWKHEVELEEKNEKEFKEDDGLMMVDEYSRLEKVEREAKKKKEELKENIVKFAEQKGIDVVWGTDSKASVKPYDKIEYPKTDEFISLLKDKGLFEEVAVVNNMKLRTKVTKKEVDNDILELIKTEKGWIVRVSKR